MREIIVVGAGVIGLTSAIRLLEAGHRVRILARDFPPHTTSDVAGAIWYPYEAYPTGRVLPWAVRSLEVYGELAKLRGSGVRWITLTELYRQSAEHTWWDETALKVSRPAAASLPPGIQDARRARIPLIEIPVYMPQLVERFLAAEGKFEQVELGGRVELASLAEVVINCSGLGSRLLANDPGVFPIRGQVVRVRAPGVDSYLLEATPDALTHIFPRTQDCVLGGTVEYDNWSLEPEDSTTEAILRRTSALLPELNQAEVLESAVGLRPGRREVRLEAEKIGGSTIIHN